MRKVIKNVKDKLFFKLVEKNPDILEEYQTYKWSIEGKENKLKSWSYIGLLNMKHRVLKIEVEKNYSKTRTRRKKSKSNLPYVDGPESEVQKRIAPEQFTKQLMNYDIVSFDIFDTLILRPFSRPYHLFMILAEKHDYVGFVSVRIQAEKEARERALLKKGNREITLYDIYGIIEERTGIDKNFGVEVEFKTELDFCFPNPYMVEVYNILKSHGKKIIAISDMYMTTEMIRSLLKKNGYNIEDVYVSSEWNGSKRDRNLYKTVINLIDPLRQKSIIHVGDNYETDIVAAREIGIQAKYYKNVHEVGNPYRATGMTELIGSVYSGIVNTHIHNGKSTYNIYYEYGFIYGGLYVLGYCNWIRNYALKHKIDKLLFLSRDGHIYQKVFNRLFDDIDNEYVYWSRIANMKYAIEKNKEDFLKRIVRQKAANAIEGSLETTIEAHFNALEMREMLNLLPQYGLKADEIIHSGNVKQLEQLFIENWDLVVVHYSEDEQIVKEYLVNIIGSSKKVAIIDVGWLGSSGMGIKYLIEEKWGLDCEVRSLVAASWRKSHTMHMHKLLKNETEAYLFSRLFNRNLYSIHGSNKGLNSIFFELFTQAPHPSFSGFSRQFDGTYKMNFDVPEIENYSIINEIHRGILDFADEYRKIASLSPMLLNIPGIDAYKPFSHIIQDVNYFKKHFGNMLFSRGVLANQEIQSMESLDYIIEKAGL